MMLYAEVEGALAKMHMCPPEKIGAFRGRLKHLQKLGMVPASPGSGYRIVYSLEDISRWAFALELAELGVTPIFAKIIVDETWPDVQSHIVDGNCHDDQFLVMSPEIGLRCNYSVTGNPTDHVLSGARRAMILNLSALHRDIAAVVALVAA